MSSSNNQTQIRFIIAITLSMLVLLGWSYLFPPPTPDQNSNTNVAQQTNTQTAEGNQTPTPPTETAQQTTTAANTPDTNPNRILSIKTPLYEAKFDSKGAVVSSWILLKNVSPQGEKDLYSISSTKENKLPLELVSAEGRKNGLFPLQLSVGDSNLDAILNGKNYQIVGVENQNGDANIQLNGNESKTVEFYLYDQANDLEVKKTITFYADNYVTDFKLKLTRGGQSVVNPKLTIGPSIGDQGVPHYNYYAIEPEAVAYVNKGVERHHGNAFADKNGGKLAINGTVDWAGIGDTYFAMAAIPSQPVDGVVYQSVKYDYPLPEPRTDGLWGFITGTKVDKEKRHLVTAYLPVPADGSTTKVYVGSKDHFLLSQIGQQISAQVNRPIDLDSFINYGWMKTLTQPIAIPILWTINKLNGLTHSYGLAIIVFTFIFYSMLFPLRWYQSKSFKNAAKNAPKMKELQERTEALRKKGVALDDPRMREIQMEQLRLTKSAIPLGGCLPLLLQFPLLIALYIAITVSLDFRQAPFLWLPDLSSGDPFHILEFLFAGSMWAAMAFTPTAPAMTQEQAMQQKMMTYMMPAMMLWMMWGAASGLLVYWLCGNIIGFVQQLFINRWTKTPDDPTAETVSAANKKVKTSLSTS